MYMQMHANEFVVTHIWILKEIFEYKIALIEVEVVIITHGQYL